MADAKTITCPACAKSFKTKQDLAGKRVKCPSCATTFEVPKRAAAPPPEPVAVAAPANPHLDDDEDDDPNPYDMAMVDIAPRCPSCAQLMESAQSFICKFCGYNTLTREQNKTVVTVGHTFGERFVHLLPGIAALLIIVAQTAFIVFYCILLPKIVEPDSWWSYFDAESLRLWLVAFSLLNLWPLGYYAFKRFVIQPTPPDKVID